MVYRFFCLGSHYRKNLVFSWENLENARVAYDKLVSRIATLKDEGELDQAAFDAAKASFVEAMDNDLNTAQALTALYDVLKLGASDKTKLALIADFERVLDLGLLAAAEREKAKVPASDGFDDALRAEIEDAIARRRAAKKEKNFAEADRIRDELLSRGIVLVDTREGTTFKRAD
jgi:cysteinyl-tRNA synthetase